MTSGSVSRRQLLRLLGLGAALGVGAACQALAPPAPPESSAAPTRPPTATPPPAPTATPLALGDNPAPVPTFRIAIDVDPETLDPAGQTTTVVESVVDYLVEPLVRLLPDGRVAPGLAERWEPSGDGRRVRFTLRQGVRFHDGDELTAEAAKLSLERMLNPRLTVPLRAPLDASLVEAITAIDPGTLEIRLRTPFPPLVAYLTGTQMGIVSPTHARRFPDTNNEEPVGTGPYRFKERRKGESVVLERFDGYWGKQPYYPRVQVRSVPEAATRESLLLANQVEMIVQPPPSDIPALQRSGTLSVLLAPTSRTVFAAMDLTYPGGTPLAIRHARQALNHAVDREGIIRNVLFGAAAPMDAPMAPPVFGYARTGPYPFDPGRAKQLLLEAGTPRLLLKFMHPTGRSMQDAQATQVALAIAGNLREVGVDTELSGHDWPSYLASINVPEDKGTAHLHLFSWAPGFLDASQQMVQFSKAQWPPRGLATSHYTNPRVEELLDQAAREPEQPKRQELYAEAERIVWDDAPWIFLWVPSFPIVHSAKVKNVTGLPVEKFAAVYAEPA